MKIIRIIILLFALNQGSYGQQIGEVRDLLDKSISAVLTDGSVDEFVIPAKTQIKIVEAEGTPSWAVAIQRLDTKEIFWTSKKILLENSISHLEIEKISKQTNGTSQGTSPPKCPPSDTPEKSQTAIPPFDRDWTFERSNRFIRETKFDGNVEIIPREDWGARAADTSDMSSIGTVRGIVVHHSADPNVTLNGMQNHHMDVNGWADLGYHYILKKDQNGDWKIYEGRKKQYQGAHAAKKNGKNLNPGQIGVMIVGNFDPRDAENPTGFITPDLPNDFNDTLETRDKHIKWVPPVEVQYLAQPEPQAQFLLGQLTQKLKSEFPTITQVKTHGLSSELAINHGHTVCPGQGCLHLVKSIKEKFGL